MPRAQVDLRRKEYIVWSSSQTVSGIWRANGAFRRVAVTAPAGELAGAVEWALGQSRTGLPDLTTRRGPLPFQPVLDDLKLSSYATYMKGTRSAAVEREGTATTVTPFVNQGARGGFAAALNRAVKLELPAPANLEQAIVAALGD
ncbi:MAG TPA: hypothetical protein VFC19_01380 [Candidatus Limnocylindrales bacterium]|nr:hypothetical protein [Candidatus Limnocylindrales bacterium]